MTFSEQFMYLVDELAKRIGIVIDWTNANVMPYLIDLITRYGQFHLAINSTMFIICLLVAILCVWGWLKANDFDNLFELDPNVAFPLTILTILSLFGLFHFGYQTIQLLFIPEWFVFEQLQGLM